MAVRFNNSFGHRRDSAVSGHEFNLAFNLHWDIER
jgi:hypothetical protein